MPLTDAVPDALAKIYARSLFDLAQAEGGQPAIERSVAELDAVLDIARTDPRFSEFLASRILPMKARGESLRRIFDSRVSDLTVRFLLVLNQKGRLAHLPAVAAALDQLAQEAFGRVEVDVFTAGPISPAELAAIRDRLRAVLGKEPVVHPYTDESMIGGLKLRIGDQLIDASVASALRRLRERLRDGAARVRAKRDELFEPNGESAN